MIDYREKIRKLLSLADSDNEHEAKAALLKARELMAEHKLTEAEIRDAAKQKVGWIITKWECSKRRYPWMVSLSALIAENHCCRGFTQRIPGKQTFTMCFIGLEDDVTACAEIFDYAAQFVLKQAEYIRKVLRESRYVAYTAQEIKKEQDSYGYGFVFGLTEAYRVQREAPGAEVFDLVMTIPDEVDAATKGFGSQEMNPEKGSLSSSSLLAGYEDGRAFNTRNVLREAE